MRVRSSSIRIARPIAAAVTAAIMLAVLAPLAPHSQPGPVKVRASETSHAVNGTQDFSVPSDSTHIAIHWSGHPGAVVTAAFSSDGKAFSAPVPVEIDDGNGGESGGETYGAVMGVDSIQVVRVTADRPLAKLTVLALDAAGPEPMPLGIGAQADGATMLPPIITRSQWGADETLRFDPAGDEFWPREYFPLQKLIVHHTAGRNHDPNPAATVRAIYYYHAVTRRWFDIGYNYLIDEQGRVYEGRYARDFWNGEVPTSDNPAGLTVAAGHTKYYNLGSMGIALLGDFTSQPPTPAAQASLVRMLAWAAARNGIDPLGANTYSNPQTGLHKFVANIAGHRDYSATGCPGGVLYAMLPSIRKRVAAQINTWPGQIFNPARSIAFAPGTYVGRVFNASGWSTASRSATLVQGSSAPTDQLATVPHQSGSWYHVTAGTWAGYWVQASSSIVLKGAPPQSLVAYDMARPLSFPAGTYIGRRFSSYGKVTAAKTYTLSKGSIGYATKKSTIPGQSGTWYFVSYGVWRGYWVREAPGMSLGAPPPPLPTPIAIYNPARTLNLAPGTYVGRRFSAYGVPAGSYSYTLSKTSSAPTSRYSRLPGQTGNWYYIIDGVWRTYWIRQSAGTTLAP